MKTNGCFTVRPPYFFQKGSIQIGNNSYINSECETFEHAQVIIYENTFIGLNVTFTTVAHQYISGTTFGLVLEPLFYLE